jgi:hypothetical protein
MKRSTIARLLGALAAGLGLLCLAGASLFGLTPLEEAGLGLVSVGVAVALF